MWKSFSLIVVLLAATIAFAKEESGGKKKEDVGTVIGIDLGVSAEPAGLFVVVTSRFVSF